MNNVWLLNTFLTKRVGIMNYAPTRAVPYLRLFLLLTECSYTQLPMTHFCQMITFFLKYVSRNSVGEQFFLRLNMRLKLDRLLKPHS